MKPLLPPDGHAFNAAVGWHELGNHNEAIAELASISASNQKHPAVLELRWMICAEAKKWSDALIAAQNLIEAVPAEPAGWLHCAYALRRVSSGGLQQALAFLQPAAEKFPDEPVIAFNLACYACQLDQLDEARIWLKRAFDIGGKKKIKAMALCDDDLKPLWPEIEKLK
ncbi:MAG: tetratricopeptide repeat protein [Verrucomicrobia bacterium]|nr:tetratricopeptide repeat protein [Verrucomicrobiota bacterium]